MRRPTLAVLLFFFVLAVVGPLMHPYADQQASRYALTAAIWDDHTVQLDGFVHTLGRDAAWKDGHYYSDKPPLQPLAAVPFYAVYRAVGGEPATTLRIDLNLGLWWQMLWFAAIPLAVLAVMLVNIAGRLNGDGSLAAALSVVFGTMLLPFGGILFGHVLSAALLVGAVILVTHSRPLAVRLAGAGALAGAAVAAEYPVAIAVVVVGLFVLWRVRWRAAWFVAGGLPFVLFLGWYHNLAFGSPFSHPYRYNVYAGVVPDQKSFFAQFAGLSLDNLFNVLFSGRGFLIATPIVIVGFVGWVYLVKTRRGSERSFAVLALAVFLVMLMIPLTWPNPWGGASPGPRYLTAGLPLLAIGVAAAWDLRPLLTKAAVGLSVVTMVLATFTNPLILPGEQGGLGTWIGLAANGEFVATVFTMMLGNWGWVVHGILIAALGWLLARERKRTVRLSAIG